MPYRRLIVCALAFAASACDKPPMDAKATDQPRRHTVSAPARIEGADRTIQVASPFQIPALAVVVKQGQHVNAGDVVVILDCKDLAFEVQALKEEAASLHLTALKVAGGTRKEEVLAADARNSAAAAMSIEAKAREARILQLYSKGMVSQAGLDDARKSAAVLDYDAKATQATLSLVTAGPLRLEIDAAHGRAKAALSKARAAEEKARKCDIRTPTSGTVLKVNVRAGEMTEAGFPVAEIADLSVTTARAEVDEKDVALVSIGSTARVRIDSGHDVSGTVIEVSPAMGRKQIKTHEPADKTDRDVREVVVRLKEPLALPVGYRVNVIFGGTP